MKISEKDFKARKIAVLEHVMPHLLDPESCPMPRISLDDCALLMAPSADKVMSRSAMNRLEQTVLAKMREGFERIGVKSVADIMSL